MHPTLLIYSGFHLGRTYMSNLLLAYHLSIGSSMVRAFHRSSEGCGLDPRLGLRNRFLSIELDDRSSLLSYVQAVTFLKS